MKLADALERYRQGRCSAADLPGLKMASVLGPIAQKIPHIGESIARHGNALDLTGLGVLAVPSAFELAHENKNRKAGIGANRANVGKALAEIGGLGLIAAPVAASILSGKPHV